MKIKNIVKRKNKLISLNILKSKLYRKSQVSTLKSKTKQTELHLKKVAQIVYRYQLAGKRILFLGFPLSFQSILKQTKHILIPESSWLNGIITNQILRFNYTLTKQQKRLPFKIVQLLLQLKKKIDLVVVFNLNKNFNALEECYSARIPIVGGSQTLDICEDKVTYKILSDFKFVNDKSLNSNFFVSMIKMVLKKSIIMTSKKLHIKYQNNIKNKFRKKYKINRTKTTNRKYGTLR